MNANDIIHSMEIMTNGENIKASRIYQWSVIIEHFRHFPNYNKVYKMEMISANRIRKYHHVTLSRAQTYVIFMVFGRSWLLQWL